MTSASRSLTDLLDPARARALQATLGHNPSLRTGDALPPFYHQIYFWDPQPPAALGEDGHPATGDALIPDLGLPQRMWAGGALQFERPLILGQPAEKITTCDDVVRKEGRSGPLAFVTLKHDIQQNGQSRIIERQTLVYRRDGAIAGGKPPRTDRVAVASERRVPDATLLFRYSALTFNGHRIHYDPVFATGPGGYGGLVVHGPLLAQWLIDLAQKHVGPLAHFTFRAHAPLILGEEALVCCDASGLWVQTADGRLRMTAEVEGQ